MTYESNEISLKEILNKLIDIKAELKKFIEASKDRLSLNIEEFRNKVNKLKNENIELKNKVEQFRTKSK